MLNLGLKPGAIVSIPVRDLKKSIAWYREVFGFEVVHTLEAPVWCELSTATRDLRIGLAQVRGGQPGDTTPIFRVYSVEAAEAALASRQVATSEVVTVAGQSKLLTLEDPDGNTLMLQEILRTAK